MKTKAKSPGLLCPNDGTLMERIPVAGVEADRCAACGAIWLDAREFERIVAEDGAPARLDTGPAGSGLPKGFRIGKKVCPRDKREMLSVRDPEQSHIVTDLCPTCGGLLFDAGELGDLSRLTLRERLRGLVRRLNG